MNKTSRYRKVYQREVNRCVRKVNKSIEKDWLWAGRFYVRQKAAYFHTYEDHSGADFVIKLACYDRKTGQVETRFFTQYGFETRLWMWVNACITDFFEVWNEDPNPYKQAAAAGRFPPDCRLA